MIVAGIGVVLVVIATLFFVGSGIAYVDAGRKHDGVSQFSGWMGLTLTALGLVLIFSS